MTHNKQLLLFDVKDDHEDMSCSSAECFGAVCQHYNCAKCGGKIEGVTGSYSNDGRIYNGYFCLECGAHLYLSGHLVTKKV